MYKQQAIFNSDEISARIILWLNWMASIWLNIKNEKWIKINESKEAIFGGILCEDLWLKYLYLIEFYTIRDEIMNWTKI